LKTKLSRDGSFGSQERKEPSLEIAKQLKKS